MEIKNSPKYVCEICDYGCNKNSDMLKHFDSIKHKTRKNGNNISKMEINNSPNNLFDCSCGKTYKQYSGLWKHKLTPFFISNADFLYNFY